MGVHAGTESYGDDTVDEDDEREGDEMQPGGLEPRPPPALGVGGLQGIKETRLANNLLTLTEMAIVLVVIIAGAPHGKASHLEHTIAYEPCNTLSNTFQNPCELPRIYNSWCPVQTLFPSLYSLQIGGGRRPLLGWISSTLLPAPSSRLNVFVTSESLRRLRSYFCLQLPVRLNQQGPAHDGAAPSLRADLLRTSDLHVSSSSSSSHLLSQSASSPPAP